MDKEERFEYVSQEISWEADSESEKKEGER
jgi:hypothetical protein